MISECELATRDRNEAEAICHQYDTYHSLYINVTNLRREITMTLMYSRIAVFKWFNNMCA